MADKNTKKGLPAPVSKPSSEPEKSAYLSGAVIAASFHFAVIFVCAAGLGYLLHFADEHWEFVPKWMIEVGHWVDYLLYGYDIIGFVFDVSVHFYRHMKHGWKELRKERSKKENE